MRPEVRRVGADRGPTVRFAAGRALATQVAVGAEEELRLGEVRVGDRRTAICRAPAHASDPHRLHDARIAAGDIALGDTQAPGAGMYVHDLEPDPSLFLGPRARSQCSRANDRRRAASGCCGPAEPARLIPGRPAVSQLLRRQMQRRGAEKRPMVPVRAPPDHVLKSTYVGAHRGLVVRRRPGIPARDTDRRSRRPPVDPGEE